MRSDIYFHKRCFKSYRENLIMFNRRHLAISLLFPFLIAIGIIVGSVAFETVGRWAILALYTEHLLIALAFGTDLQKNSTSGSFVAIALVPWAAVAALVIDYLILAVITYVVLLIKARISAKSINLRSNLLP